MQIFEGLEEFQKAYPQGLPASVVTVGNFDGVHRGHQKLIENLKALGQSHGAPTVVMTFHPHPLKVIDPEKSIFRLFPLHDQEAQLSLYGVDILLRLKFDLALAKTPAEKFFMDYLLGPLKPKAIVVGHDFHFGKDRGGDFSRLRVWGQEKGIEVQQVSAYQLHGQTVSSSRIRELLSQAKLAEAYELLGRNFYVEGSVVEGDKRGEKLGIPTANVAAPDGLPLPRGVYVTAVWCGGEKFKAVTNVGLNPTFEDPNRKLRVESFIFNLNKNLYGEIIRVEFYKFLRTEKKFKDAAELIEQINTDIKEAHEYWDRRN